MLTTVDSPHHLETVSVLPVLLADTTPAEMDNHFHLANKYLYLNVHVGLAEEHTNCKADLTKEQELECLLAPKVSVAHTADADESSVAAITSWSYLGTSIRT